MGVCEDRLHAAHDPLWRDGMHRLRKRHTQRIQRGVAARSGDGGPREASHRDRSHPTHGACQAHRCVRSLRYELDSIDQAGHELQLPVAFDLQDELAGASCIVDEHAQAVDAPHSEAVDRI